MRPHDVVERWAEALPAPSTSERVHEDLWYVRLPGEARRWIPIEILLDERTTKLTSHVIPEPPERVEEVFRFLLRHNHRASGVAFSLDGREAVLCLVTRIPHGEITVDRLDLAAGRVVETTEETFRTIIEIGFGSYLRRGG